MICCYTRQIVYLESYVSQSAKEKNTLSYQFTALHITNAFFETLTLGKVRFYDKKKKKNPFRLFMITAVFLRMLYRTVRRFLTRQSV